MFRRILIANRGEIAVRIMRSAKRMGIETVAVYSDIDATALHVQQADRAVCIGGAEATDSYLNMDAVLQAARDTGAEAIHPGYGFLSENSAFARACEQQGVVFIGPPASAMDAMASKSAAKQLMQESSVPVLPGYHGDAQDHGTLKQAAESTGYPLMLKASSGGGGKGMRIVANAGEFDSMLESVKRESLAAFGDDHVLLERYLEQPRHIEIQVFSDTHDNHLHLHERDCSVQRRHQKVLEESPAPGITDEQRERMGQAAVNAAKAIGYVGAGTVEFIADSSGEFYFMEMNTRLQVEHPVTEMVTGTDLVEWQLRVAAGESLPAEQADIVSNGHAIEARVYAEDPANDFLPASGKLEHVFFADNPAWQDTLRIETGVRSGDTVSVYYDPMIAKIIAWDETREGALQKLATAIEETSVLGPATNLQYLKYLLEQPGFQAGGVSTHFIASLESSDATDSSDASSGSPWHRSDTAITVAALEHWLGQTNNGSYGFRLNRASGSHQLWELDETTQRVVLTEAPPARSTDVASNNRQAFHLQTHSLTVKDSGDDSDTSTQTNIELVAYRRHASDTASSLLGLLINGIPVEARVTRTGNKTLVKPMRSTDGYLHPASITVTHRSVAELSTGSSDTAGNLTSPMPGKVTVVHVNAGDNVTKGQPLLAVEAMKMEHVITAPEDGRVEEVCFSEGEPVGDKAVLVRMSDGVPT